MNNNINMLFVLLTEISEEEKLLQHVINSIKYRNMCSYILLNEIHHTEGDVYVNNYYEEVVPYYAEQTYRSHFRMSRQTMNILIEEIRMVLQDQNINVNNMLVSLEKKVHITLWMLANFAVAFRECGTLFGISTGTVHFIFMQICAAFNLLCERFIKWPNPEKCEELSEVVYEKTRFPGVIGALDGCHIEIKAPCAENAYDYYNGKHFYSVVLQGVCDSSLKFIDTFVGLPGKVHDARVFRLSPLSRQINLGLIPEDKHLLADAAYGVHENILTPFRDNGHLTRQQRRFNAKHSSIRSSIERAFGLLKNKFRRLRFLDMNLLEEIPTVITACCVLHNFVILFEGYQQGEDVIDDLDEVPDLEGHRPLNFQNGEVKRNNIAALF